MRPPMPKVVMLIRRLPSEFLVGAPDQLAKISAARLGARPIQWMQRQRLTDARPHLDDGIRDLPICADRSEPRTRERRLARFIGGDVPLAGSLIKRMTVAVRIVFRRGIFQRRSDAPRQHAKLVAHLPSCASLPPLMR